MKQHDILLNTKQGLEWVCELFCDDLQDAIRNAIQAVGGGKYVGHRSYQVQNGAWVEVAA